MGAPGAFENGVESRCLGRVSWWGCLVQAQRRFFRCFMVRLVDDLVWLKQANKLQLMLLSEYRGLPW